MEPWLIAACITPVVIMLIEFIGKKANAFLLRRVSNKTLRKLILLRW